eukprot:bmy_22412T0
MEPPLAHARRGCIPWNGLLLAVSLVTFWNLPTTAHLTIESVPFNAAEGTDVLLLVHNVTGDLLGYGWYRGERVEKNQLIASRRIDGSANATGPAHSGRETMYPNGSLLFQNVTQNDTGYYTLLITKNDLQIESVTGQLHVYPVLPKPVITSNNSNPKEQEDTVVLTCGPETPNTSHMWWINNQSLPNSTRLELSEDSRTLTLFHVTRNDTGPYMCETRNPVSVSRSDPFTLNVICEAVRGDWSGVILGYLGFREEVQPSPYGSSPEERPTTLFTGSGPISASPLQSSLGPGNPVAQPSIEASNTTVTEHENTVVLTCRTNDTGISICWFFNGQRLLLTERMKLSPDNSTLTINPVRREDAGDYQCEVSNQGNSSKSDPLRLDVKFDSTQGSSSGLSGGAIAGIVIAVLAGIALTAALVYFLYLRKTE